MLLITRHEGIILSTSIPGMIQCVSVSCHHVWVTIMFKYYLEGIMSRTEVSSIRPRNTSDGGHQRDYKKHCKGSAHEREGTLRASYHFPVQASPGSRHA